MLANFFHRCSRVNNRYYGAVFLVLMMATGCTLLNPSQALYKKDELNRRVLVTTSDPELAVLSYQKLNYQTYNDKLYYLKVLYSSSNFEEFKRFFQSDIEPLNRYFLKSEFEFLNECGSDWCTSILQKLEQHNKDFINTRMDPEETRQLIAMLQADQSIREQFITEYELNGMSDKLMVLNDSMGRQDSVQLNVLIEMDAWKNIDSQNSYNAVGNVGIKAAFYLVQHAENETLSVKLLQCKYLEPYDKFRLIDRVRINDGQKQIYGTHTDMDGRRLPVKNKKAANKARMENGILTF